MTNMVTNISPNECVGNSLVTINANFNALTQNLNQVYANLVLLTETVDTLLTELNTLLQKQ